MHMCHIAGPENRMDGDTCEGRKKKGIEFAGGYYADNGRLKAKRLCSEAFKVIKLWILKKDCILILFSENKNESVFFGINALTCLERKIMTCRAIAVLIRKQILVLRIMRGSYMCIADDCWCSWFHAWFKRFHAWLHNHAWFPGTCNGADEVRGTEACRKPGHWIRALTEGNFHTQYHIKHFVHLKQ